MPIKVQMSTTNSYLVPGPFVSRLAMFNANLPSSDGGMSCRVHLVARCLYARYVCLVDVNIIDASEFYSNLTTKFKLHILH